MLRYMNNMVEKNKKLEFSTRFLLLCSKFCLHINCHLFVIEVKLVDNIVLVLDEQDRFFNTLQSNHHN